MKELFCVIIVGFPFAFFGLMHYMQKKEDKKTEAKELLYLSKQAKLYRGDIFSLPMSTRSKDLIETYRQQGVLDSDFNIVPKQKQTFQKHLYTIEDTPFYKEAVQEIEDFLSRP